MKKFYRLIFLVFIAMSASVPTAFAGEGVLSEAAVLEFSDISAGNFDELETALTNVPDGGIITITADIEVAHEVRIPDGKAVTVTGTDDSSYALKKAADFEESMIYIPVDSSLTLSNITLDGGANYSGGEKTALVYNYGEFVMQSGASLQDYRTTAPDGSAVYNYGLFAMEGGSIRGNTNGVYNTKGVFTMTGGEIYESDGCGIYNDGTVNLSGRITLEALYFADTESMVYITGALEPGSNITLKESVYFTLADNYPVPAAKAGAGYPVLSSADLAAFNVIGGEYKLILDNGDTEISVVKASTAAADDFDLLSELLENIEDGGIIQISEDIGVSGPLVVPAGKTVTVSGEAKTLTRTGEFPEAMFTVHENSELTLKNIILDGNSEAMAEDALLVHNKGMFVVKSGTVLRNSRVSGDLAAGVLNDGIFTMTGGEISNDIGLLNRGELNLSGLTRLYGLFINDGSNIPNITGALKSGARITLDNESGIFENLPAEIAVTGGGYARFTEIDLAAFGVAGGDYIFYLSEDETSVIADKKPPDKPASISVTPAGAAVFAGETVRLAAAAEPATANQKLIWSSGDASVASVDETGLVTGLKTGTATITAASEMDSEINGTSEITVLADAAEPEITLHPENQTAFIGKSAVFNITARSPDGGTLAYQWQESGSYGLPWTDIAGETSASYKKGSLDKSHHGMLLRCIVTNTINGTTSHTVSNEAMLTVLTPIRNIEIKADGMAVNSIKLKKNENIILTASAEPDDAILSQIKWVSNNALVAEVSLSGTVTALSPGITVVSVRSGLEPSVYAICLVTVTEDTAKPPAQITSEPDGVIKNGKIEDDFLKNKTIRLIADKDVKWASGNTKVATVNAAGEIKYLSAGATVVTATLKSDSEKSASIVLTLMDKTPRLSANALTVNSNSGTGTKFKAFSADYFGFDDIRIASANPEASAFSLDASALPVCRLSAKGVNKGKYTLELRAYKDGTPVGSAAALTVSVSDILPKPTVKIDQFNTFFLGAGSPVSITGTNLPEIEEIVLSAELNDNFYIEKQNGQFSIFARDIFGRLDSKRNPVVKGDLKIYYAGYDVPYTIKGFTVPARATPPALVMSPASQVIDPLYGTTASFEVSGGQIEKVAFESSQTIFKEPLLSENKIKLEFKSGKINPLKSQSFMARLNIMLKNARTPVLIKPKIITVKEGTGASYKLSAASVTLNSTLQNQSRTVQIIPAATNIKIDTVTVVPPAADGITVTPDIADKSRLTVSVAKAAKSGSYKFKIAPNAAAKPLELTVKVDGKAITATVRAEKGNIDLVDRKNTKITYVPSVKGTESAITGVGLEANAKNPNDGYKKFDVTLDGSGKAIITAKPDETYIKGASYKMRLKFTLESGDAVSTGDLSVKPAQSAVKHKLPKSLTIFQSRTAANFSNCETIDLAPQTPDSAKIASLTFPAGNPNNAYWYYFDENAQQLKIWLKDVSLVKPGKSSLTFGAIYEGQGVENTGTKANPVYIQKPVLLKLPVTVVG